MFWSDDDQVNVLPEIEFPLASRALAVSCTVSPREESMEFSGVTTTEATAGGPFPVGVSLPQARKGTAPINAANAKRDLKACGVMKAHTCSRVARLARAARGKAARRFMAHLRREENTLYCVVGGMAVGRERRLDGGNRRGHRRGNYTNINAPVVKPPESQRRNTI
jgi:hypothetical protein